MHWICPFWLWRKKRKNVLQKPSGREGTKYFGLSEGYFLRIQEQVELAKAKQTLGKTLDNIIPIDAFRKAKQEEQEEELLQG